VTQTAQTGFTEPVDKAGAIRVIVVDDHDLFRTGLSSLIALQPDIEVVAQASGGRAGVRLVDELHPDVVLMDLRMPDLQGAEATHQIIENHPSTRVIALTVLSEDEDVASAVQAGACGYLAKDTPVEEVLTAVRAAAQGAAWLSPRAAEVVLGRMRQSDAGTTPDQQAIDHLSERELEVLRLIARGLENAQIAETLGISPRTAKNHVSSILTKLGVPNRIQAAIYAVRRGLE
jgi:DNA-binding NarL/FixJ family response regulator